EKIPVTSFVSSAEASRAVAADIADLIRANERSGQRAVLGLATGSTPTGVYDELVRLHREEGLSFKNVVTFNLDEYFPMKPGDIQSYVRFMREHLFDLVDIDPYSWNVPDGTIARDKVGEYCERYERLIAAAGGIDLQILGIGRTGHVGFNEPGSSKESRTRLITLDKVTKMDAASDFFGEWNVPRTAITMGVGTILSAKRVVLLAFGEHKAAIIKRAVEGEVTPAVAASFLQEHPSAKIVLDQAASAELTRFKTPWLLGELKEFGLSWDAATTKRAAIWLARTLDKPLLKLTDEDYSEHGLQELLISRGGGGGAYDINIEVFRSLSSTITGWPGGKPAPGSPALRTVASGWSPSMAHAHAVQSSQAPGSESRGTQGQTYPKRVILFSPHPDDDVISMGGTFIRLCEQGHDVHVAYQTSGNIAVWDETALRHADFVTEYAQAFFRGKTKAGEAVAEQIEQSVAHFIRAKKAGEVDIPELQTIKGLIRRTEARAGARFSGVRDDSRIHFLDLPFYETGTVKKKPLSEADVKITADLLERVKPHQVYAAGDLSDPHGTHRVCLAAITTALHRLKDRPWMKDCTVWLYRGAWQEWGAHEIEMAVPLSPDEVIRKRFAIFKHESQKDKALFPGPNDPREFWQRAEDRNRNTAKLYDQLGLAEYEAIEGFVRWKPSAQDGTVADLVGKKARASSNGHAGARVHKNGKAPKSARTARGKA
ncbi:MAG: glucosamine-6-phosphate deaminase, partial [Phycisphaerales bacterium]|nr:glucosamine-6-phosphate deaminase [Phycisphaerales bacterium]